MHRRNLLPSLTAVVAMACLPPVLAQDFPNRPIRLVVPFPAGGSNDIAARTLAPRLQAVLGQSIVVENRAGAAGAIGVENVAKSPPDGYSLVLTAPGAVAINQHFRNLPYDPAKDLAPVTLVATVPTAIAVHPSLPVRTLGELLAFARTQQDGLNFSVSGQGSQTHLAGELLAATARIKLTAVPYRGTAPATTAIAGGEVAFGISDLTTLTPLVKAGRIRTIAVVDAKRPLSAPDLPTVAESGLPGFQASGWMALFTTGGTPPAVVQRLNAAFTQVLREPEVETALRNVGLEAAPGTSQQLQQFLQVEIGKWGKVIHDANIKAE